MEVIDRNFSSNMICIILTSANHPIKLQREKQLLFIMFDINIISLVRPIKIPRNTENTIKRGIIPFFYPPSIVRFPSPTLSLQNLPESI